MTGDRRMPDAMHSAAGIDRIEVVIGVERPQTLESW